MVTVTSQEPNLFASQASIMDILNDQAIEEAKGSNEASGDILCIM